MMNAETFALIVGGGPVGLAAAIELHWRAVPTMLVTENLETAQHPKCNNTNARSMEHFRRLGIADELRSEGLTPHSERASAYVTRFCGHEFGRLPRPYSDWPTPEIPNNVPQMVLERALRRCAERSSSAQIHFGWRLNSFAERDDEVVADVENVQTGERQRITSRYLLGIDGASSTVRRVLGFAMIGGGRRAARLRREDHAGRPPTISHRRHSARRALRDVADRVARRRWCAARCVGHLHASRPTGRAGAAFLARAGTRRL